MGKRKYTTFLVIIAFLAYVIIMLRFTGGLCMLKAFFGFPCPACGSTRAILLLGKGDVKGCMELNPSAPLLLLCILNEIRINYFVRGDNKKFSKIFLVVCVLISLIVYIVRMKMYFPYREPYVFNSNCLFIKLLKIIKK